MAEEEAAGDSFQKWKGLSLEGKGGTYALKRIRVQKNCVSFSNRILWKNNMQMFQSSG